MFVDLDAFKSVNDRLGHGMGDQVLVHFADMLRKLVRPSDLITRLGGDEFAVWLSGADHMTAAERADHLCKTAPLELQEILPEAFPEARCFGRHRHPPARQRGVDRGPDPARRHGDVRGKTQRPAPLARVAAGWRRMNADEATRVRQGASASTSPDVLRALATIPR